MHYFHKNVSIDHYFSITFELHLAYSFCFKILSDTFFMEFDTEFPRFEN